MPSESPSAVVSPGRFVIVAVPRTGSKLLVEMLDSHPEILCHTEVFNPKSTYLSRKPEISIGTKDDRDRNPWSFLQKLYGTHAGRRMVGFKIMPSHNDKVLLRLLLSRRTRKIILTRKHWLHAYVSNQLALTTRQYHVASSARDARDEIEKPRAVRVDVANFRTYLRKVRAYYGVIRLIESVTRQQFFWVDYTALQDRDAMTRLLGFLGVGQRVALEVRLKKQGSADLSERIENYAEVAESLRGTPWERFLELETSPAAPASGGS